MVVVSLGAPPDPAEMSRLEQEFAELTPACQQYFQSIGVRLQRMLDAGEIQQKLDKLPW